MAAPDATIALLMDAEAEARRVVEAARREKTARLKQAKEEAAEEVAAYRKSREEALTVRLAESMDSSGSLASALSERTNAEIERLRQVAARNSEACVDMLLQHVTAPPRQG